MKVVIDLPEKLYNYIKSDNYDEHLDRRFDYKVRFAVKEGIPLPKGHGRLIDVNEYFSGYFNDAREFLDKAATIIEADTGEDSETD